MNFTTITPESLRRAASIKEQIEALNKELARILGRPVVIGEVTNNHRTMSTAARRKIAAAQRAR